MNGAGNHFLVERPKVFERSATARKDDNVNFAARLFFGGQAEVSKRAGDFFRRFLALYAHGIENQMDVFKAPLDHGDHVGDNRASRRCDQSDALRQCGNRPFSGCVKEPFFSELGLEMLKRQLQRPEPGRFEMLHDHLILAAHFVDREMPTRHDAESVSGFDLGKSKRASEDDGPQLSARVFEREVDVSRGRRFEIRNLALDPYVAELALQHVLQCLREIADGIDRARHYSWSKPRRSRWR